MVNWSVIRFIIIISLLLMLAVAIVRQPGLSVIVVYLLIPIHILYIFKLNCESIFLSNTWQSDLSTFMTDFSSITENVLCIYCIYRIDECNIFQMCILYDADVCRWMCAASTPSLSNLTLAVSARHNAIAQSVRCFLHLLTDTIIYTYNSTLWLRDVINIIYPIKYILYDILQRMCKCGCGWNCTSVSWGTCSIYIRTNCGSSVGVTAKFQPIICWCDPKCVYVFFCFWITYPPKFVHHQWWFITYSYGELDISGENSWCNDVLWVIQVSILSLLA